MKIFFAVTTGLLSFCQCACGGITSEYIRKPASPELPLQHSLLRGRRESSVEQVTLTPYNVSSTTGETFYTVTFATREGNPVSVAWSSALEEEHESDQIAAKPFRSISHVNMYSSINWKDNSQGKYTNGDDLYSSPMLHSTLIGPFQPNSRYAYSIGGGQEWVFNTPMKPSRNSTLKFIVAGDIGQTEDSAKTFHHILDQVQSESIPLLLHVGDISYADGYHPRWDSYGRFAEFVHARLPTVVTGGNHEVSNGESWVAYETRFPMPYQQSSTSKLWFSYKSGPVHFIVLCSYAPTHDGSPQHVWLQSELAGIDRSVSPWLVVNMHGPFYGSNVAHTYEKEDMRKVFEPLFTKYQVDLVFTGHVHAYERLLPMRNHKLVDCGTVHIIVGDGGNREGPSRDWKPKQPKWSAFRESSFGYGALEVVSETKARWKWHRNDDVVTTVADQVEIDRCTNWPTESNSESMIE